MRRWKLLPRPHSRRHPQTHTLRQLTKFGKPKLRLSQWFKAFRSVGWKAEVKHVKDLAVDDFQNYSLVHLNACGTNLNLIKEVKDAIAGSSTKLIVNMDYPLETFEPAFNNPWFFAKSLMMADFIFAQEPSQQAFLTYLLKRTTVPGLGNRFYGKEDFKVPLVPHPCQTGEMKKLFVPYEERNDGLVFVYHRYAGGQIWIPGWVVQDLKLPTGEQIPLYATNLVVETSAMDRSAAPMLLWDYSQSAQTVGNWDKWVYLLAHSTLGFSYYTIHSWDRFICEAASLGVPVVCTNLSYSGTQLFPNICHDVLDLSGMRNSFDRLVSDEDFYQRTTKFAFDKIEEYNWKASVDRLFEGMRAWGIEADDL